jgi:Rho-type GTPase-activating protein 1/2
MSQRSDLSGGGEEFLIPLAFDPTPPVIQSPTMPSHTTPRVVEEKSRDYFSKPGASPGMAPASQSKTASPHIAYQEKGRLPSRDVMDNVMTRKDGSGSGSESAAPSPQTSSDPPRRPSEEPVSISQVAGGGLQGDDKFKLQEAPKTKRPSHSSKDSRQDAAARNGPLLEATVSGPMQDLDAFSDQAYSTPRMSLESSPASMNNSPKLPQHPTTAALIASIPKRGDSLDSAKRSQAIPRKELKPSANISQPIADVLQNTAANNKTPPTDLEKANGGKIISAPIESPNSKSLYDTPSLQSESGKTGTQSFVDPRAPPAPPGSSRSRNESVSTMPDGQKSPTLPRYSSAGGFTMDEDMARIMGDEESGSSFLRRVSNSVRHGRSYSDKAGRMSRDRWPRSPGMGSTLGQEISSPTSTSPEHREELAWFKNELRKERQKLLDREKRIAELESQIGSSADIKQANVELREKRSTMVVLDTQKEIVVRELEVLTDHIANAKANKEPLDVGKMTNAVLRDLAARLEKLKNSFAPMIEDSIQKRNELVDEIANLTQMKDKSFAEFEQLSSKNAQLAELNNQLVTQIQELYKANSGPTNEPTKVNGLGIYAHHKDRSNVSVDSREIRNISVTDASIGDSGTTLAAGEAEPVTVLQGPQVVNIRKGQAKKFDWRKGQKVAKGVTKGLKGAFSSAQQSYSRDLQFAETGAYGGNLQGQEYSQMSKTGQEPMKQGGFGFFAGNQKGGVKPNGLYATQGNTSTPSLLVDASARGSPISLTTVSC